MLIRSAAILLLIMAGVMGSFPPLVTSSSSQAPVSSSLTRPAADPAGSLAAFNYTYSQALLFSGNSTNPNVFPPSNTTGTSYTPQPSVISTTTKTPIPNSGFRFDITAGKFVADKQVVNWTLAVPQFNCNGCTSDTVNFDIFGNLTKGTSVTYSISLAAPNSTVLVGSGSFTQLGAFHPNATASCPESACIDVTSYIGYAVVLSFKFVWNATTSPGMFAQVSKITVSSTGNVKQANTNVMAQDPSNSSRVIHTTDLKSVAYNSSVLTHLHPGTANSTRPWQTELINVYYPAGYKLQQINLNGTALSIQLNNTVTSPLRAPFENLPCAPGTGCAASLVALNMSDFHQVSKNSNMTIISRTLNSIVQVSTLSGGVPNTFFTAGNDITIKVVNKPSIVNASTSHQTGSLDIIFPSALSIPTGIINTATGGLYNFTLPSNCGFGLACPSTWSFSVAFTSGYDLGNATGSFTIDLLRVKSFSTTGGSNSLSVTGSLEYGNGAVASGLNTTLFAIDHGTPVNTPVTNAQTAPVTSQTLLYISNVTLVNGVLTAGQTLILFFTLANNTMTPYNASITIQHLWPGPQAHNMSTTFSLHPGDALNDLPFNRGAQTYEAQITFTGSGVQVSLSNLRTIPNSITQTMTQGTSPVLPNAPHAGLFSVTATSILNGAAQSPTSSLNSPTYADVSTSMAPGRYLYASPVFQTDSNGAFSQTINSNSLLGAKNLTVFVLARAASGIVVVNNLPTSGFSDSTTLVASVDSLGAVQTSSTVTATLHLKSNSTKTNGITQVIHIVVTVNGGTGPEQNTVTIRPGETVTVPVTFTAPSSVGSYTVSYSSPEYGGVLTSQTLQVSVLSSYAQLLIPAGIGVGAAILILFFLMFRGKRTAETGEEVTKKAPSQKPKPSTGGTQPTKSLTRTKPTEE
ncbi:hypothetical protein J2P12_01415 [Candidatus Bathyarchaeota archaeon]|nr:hypothetical protein [Candidatus Bathyarchaeota archaeon]